MKVVGQSGSDIHPKNYLCSVKGPQGEKASTLFDLRREGAAWFQLRNLAGRRYQKIGGFLVVLGVVMLPIFDIGISLVIFGRVTFFLSPGMLPIPLLFAGCGTYLMVEGRRMVNCPPPVELAVESGGLTFRYASGRTETWNWPSGGRRWAVLHFVTHVRMTPVAPELGAFGATISYIAPSLHRHIPLSDPACEAITASAESAGLHVERRRLPFEDVEVYRSDIHR